VHAERGPGELRGVAGLAVDGEQPVGMFDGDVDALGPECGDEDGNLDGRWGACPGGCSICIRVPRHCTIAPPSRARNART